MITKEQFAQSLVRECDIILHLFAKLSPEQYDYQPSAEQRTTTMLLRYLSICAIGGIDCMQHKDWKRFASHRERVQEMPASEFPSAMERQKEEILQFFSSITEEALQTQEATMPFGTVLPLGLAIMEGPLKWLAAYKMQLFLYAKASGSTQLKTSNLWRGADPQPAP